VEDQYLSVSDFAKAARVSPQAIYQRIDKDLNEYVSTIKGRKHLNREALGLFGVDVDLKNSTSDSQESQELFKALQEQLAVLNNQLSVKDSQIQELNNQLKTKDKQIDALTTLVDQAQHLNAADKLKSLDSGSEQQQKTEEVKQEEKKWYQFWK
jgi:chromosome segregation ATPase